MPIFSYLAIPKQGAKDDLCLELSSLDYCQVVPAENREVVILVTDTPDKSTEKKLQKQIQAVPSLQSISLSFGYDDQQE